VKLALGFVAAIAFTLLAGVGAGLSASDPGSEEVQRLRALLDAPVPNPKEHNPLELPSSGSADFVAKLRKSLDPTEVYVSGVPTFDFDTAYDLYQRVLAPVESGWKGAQELLIVPHGALSELPFAVLVTGTFKPGESAVPFADHAAAPWLLQKAAISYLPTVAGLASLRRATTQPPERAFIGFGDPVFAAASTSDSTGPALASRGIQRRNLKVPTRSISAPENQS
jgi:CHAT domain